jgi:DNA-binding response OmpR family regulator
LHSSARTAILRTLRQGKEVLPEHLAADQTVCPTATEGSALNGQRSVLIVDQSEETREVLQTALARRGVRTLATGHAAEGMELVRRHQPDLVVLDLEVDDMPADGFGNCGVAATSTSQDGPRYVLLGSLRRQGSLAPGGEFVAKPYHYGLLMRRIEELLGNARESRSCRRCSSFAESIKEAASN